MAHHRRTARRPDGLTQRQADVLAVFSAFRQVRGYPPTMLELARALGLPHESSVVCHYFALVRKGRILRAAKQARAVGLTAAAPLPLLTLEQAKERARGL
jgi:repressor LexA